MAEHKCEIRDLQLNKKPAFLVALIIAKSEKNIVAKRDINKSALTITVRDSKEHFINCTLWGSHEYIAQVDGSYNIGDVVEIAKPSVVQRNDDSRYMPRTTSPFLLRMDEKKSFIYRQCDHPALRQLKNVPLKSTSLAMHLCDVADQLITKKSLFVDLIVVVQAIDTVRSVNTKNGPRPNRRIHLFDQTADSVEMVLWGKCSTDMVDKWTPMETILHLIDVRAEYSEYDSANILTMDYRTIVTENPIHCHRAKELKAYANEHKALHKFHKSATDAENVDQITEVMTVQKILDKLAAGETRVAVIVYGILTKFEIDPRYGASPVVRSCRKCNRYLAKDVMRCVDSSCVAAQADVVDRFSILTWVSDHTGTLVCRVNDAYATTMLKYNATAFKQLPETQIDQIGKRYVLQRFAVKAIVKPKQGADYSATIVDISPQSPMDIMTNLRTY